MNEMNNNQDSDYVSTLDEASLKKAKEELNEDPKERLSSVNALRQWILAQPHIQCPTDTLTLLAFLRARKFSQLETRQLVEDFVSVKTKHKQWFQDLDTLDPGIQAVFKDGFVYSLQQRDSEGRQILVMNLGKMQPWAGRYTKVDIFRAMVCVSLNTFFSDEMTQVNGCVALDDLTGMSMKHQTMFSIEDQKSFFGGWHRCIPARIKQIVIYNLGGFGEFVFMIIRLVMPEKIQKRVTNVGSVTENLYKEIPMELLPSDYHPDDYKGPHGGTVQENIDRLLLEISDQQTRERVKYLSSSKFCVDESKRPKDTVSASFRKLTVD